MRVWYFVDPETGEHCYYLYYVDGKYQSKRHLERTGKAMFRIQTYSRKQRLYFGSRINPMKLPQITDPEKEKRKVAKTLNIVERARAKKLEYIARYVKK
jgi:hypothetical protein